MSGLRVEPEGSAELGVCHCCGQETRRVWGYIHDSSGPHAAYFVTWTQDRVEEHGARFDIVVGAWGEGTQPADRSLVLLDYRPRENAFMIIDASNDDGRFMTLAAHTLMRDDVIDTPLAKIVFDICDAVCLQDERLAPLALAA